MKNILIIIFLFCSFNSYSVDFPNPTRIEERFNEQNWCEYEILTENCHISPGRLIWGNETCPVFIDESGFRFMVVIQHGKIHTLDLEDYVSN